MSQPIVKYTAAVIVEGQVRRMSGPGVAVITRKRIGRPSQYAHMTGCHKAPGMLSKTSSGTRSTKRSRFQQAPVVGAVSQLASAKTAEMTRTARRMNFATPLMSPLSASKPIAAATNMTPIPILKTGP